MYYNLFYLIAIFLLYSRIALLTVAALINWGLAPMIVAIFIMVALAVYKTLSQWIVQVEVEPLHRCQGTLIRGSYLLVS